MPTNSVYDIRHLELDNVGRGKNRVVRPPGGDCHDIFGTRSPSSNGSSTPGSPGSSTPGSRRGSLVHDTQHRLFGAPEEKPRRVRDNLKSTIFDDQVDHTPKPSPKRQVGVGNGSSGIQSILTAATLNGNGTATPNGGGSSINGLLTPVSCASPICPSTPVRGTPNGSRRPSLDTKSRLFNVHGDDTSSNGSLSPVPSTPTRCRMPPGGKSSGIF